MYLGRTFVGDGMADKDIDRRVDAGNSINGLLIAVVACDVKVSEAN